MELESFYNDGFGWICRRCERELQTEGKSDPEQQRHSRLLTEGEAESKTPMLSNRAMAKWADKLQSVLICPRCGVTETVENLGGRF